MGKKLFLCGLIILVIAISQTYFNPSSFFSDQKLKSIIEKADRLVVYDGPWEKSNKLYESTNQKDFVELSLATRLPLFDGNAIMSSISNLQIKLYFQGKEIGCIQRVRGGGIIRFGLTYDAHPLKPELFNQWFTNRGIDLSKYTPYSPDPEGT